MAGPARRAGCLPSAPLATLFATTLLAIVTWSAPSAQAAPQDGSGTSAGGSYVAIAPLRVLDTRSGLGATGPVTSDQTISVDLLPHVEAGATAAVLNVTVTDTASSGYVSVWPAGETRPVVSNLNFAPGQTVANLVTVGVAGGGTDPSVDMVVHTAGAESSAQLIADLEGYYAPPTVAPSAAGLYHPLAPARVCDTRGEPWATPNQCNSETAQGRPIGAGRSIAVQLTGQGGVPAAGVSAVALTLTEADATQPSYLSVWPAGQSLPTASNLNFTPGSGPVPNEVIVPVNAAGKVAVYNDQGDTDVAVDISGWFGVSTGSGPAGDAFVPVPPTRLVDTRGPDEDASGPTGQEEPLGPGESRTFQLGNTWAAGNQLVPANAEGVAANVTAADDGPVSCDWYALLASGEVPYGNGTDQVCSPGTPAAGYATSYPAGQRRPTTSVLNWSAGENVADASLISLSDTRVSIYNGSPTGTVHVIVDVSGYFVPAGSSAQWTSQAPLPSSTTLSGPAAPVAGTRATLSVQVSGSAWGYASVSDVTDPNAPSAVAGCAYVPITNGSGSCSAAFPAQGARSLGTSFEPTFPGQHMPALSWGNAPSGPVTTTIDVTGLSPTSPVYPHDFPDPTVLRVGGTYYAYATNTGNPPNVTDNIPVLESTDLQHWTPEGDALPQLPVWGTSFFTWAPTVLADPAGGYVMFYTEFNNYVNEFCIDRATAASPLGPFVDGPLPFLCTQDGVIDPDLFVDSSGQAYLLFKDNARALIYSMPLDPTLTEGTRLPALLLSPTLGWEDGIVEGPTMADAGGAYHLFFGGNSFGSPGYSVGHAVCSSPLGPCTPDPNPFVAQNPEAQGPGGPDVFSDPSGNLYLAYAAWTYGIVGYPYGGRELFIQPLSFSGESPQIGY